MALPTLSTWVPSRFRNPGAYMDWQRERRAEQQHDLETHARYQERQSFCNERHAVWTSRLYFNRSISEYHKQCLKQERKANLEHRRNHIQTLLQEEVNQVEAELRELECDRKTWKGRQHQKKGEHSTERQEWRGKVETELLINNVVGQWLKQLPEKKQLSMPQPPDWQVSEQEERRFESESERTRSVALERMKQAGEKNKPDEKKKMEDLCKQIEELKLRETVELKEEQKALMVKQRQLQKIEKEMKQREERWNKLQMRRFLVRHYHTQMMQRAERVQEQLEAEHKILAALMEGEEEEEEMTKSSSRERAIAEVALMKRVIEEQLQMERERQAKIDDLDRQEAQRLWDEEPQREKERKVRELVMQEVLSGKQQQLMMKIQRNREAQQELLGGREELIQELHGERSPEER